MGRTKKRRKEEIRLVILLCLGLVIVILLLVSFMWYMSNGYSKLNKNYNDLKGEYSELQQSNNNLKEEYNKLQNLPNVAVLANVDGKDVELPLYSTIEAAKRNITYLKYENFFLDDVELTITTHNNKQIQDIRWMKEQYVRNIFSEETEDVEQIDNGAFVFSLNTSSNRKNLISIVCDNKKMYTVYVPIEKEN